MARYFSLWVAVTVFLAISVFTRTSAGADDFNHDQLPQMSCADLASLKLPDTRITSVQEMEAGPFPFGNVAPTCSSDIASPQLFFQAEDGIRDWSVTGVQTCALPI